MIIKALKSIICVEFNWILYVLGSQALALHASEISWLDAWNQQAANNRTRLCIVIVGTHWLGCYSRLALKHLLKSRHQSKSLQILCLTINRHYLIHSLRHLNNEKIQSSRTDNNANKYRCCCFNYIQLKKILALLCSPYFSF